jgi:hypothetical protein
MTRFLIGLLVAVVVGVGVWQIYELGRRNAATEDGTRSREGRSTRVVEAKNLRGLPPGLEPSLRAAKSQGPVALKLWLDQYGRLVADPRLADIELDYVVMVARQNPAEAKRVFARVRQRVDEYSPVYPRLERLAKTYE